MIIEFGDDGERTKPREAHSLQTTGDNGGATLLGSVYYDTPPVVLAAPADNRPRASLDWHSPLKIYGEILTTHAQRSNSTVQ